MAKVKKKIGPPSSLLLGPCQSDFLSAFCFVCVYVESKKLSYSIYENKVKSYLLYQITFLDPYFYQIVLLLTAHTYHWFPSLYGLGK